MRRHSPTRRRLIACVATFVLVGTGSAATAGAARAPAEASLTGATTIETGRRHTCVVLSDGRVRCWGDNNQGQLGDGTHTRRGVATLVSNRSGTGPLTGATQVTGGADHTCALVTGGEVRCWGSNLHGELGNGTTTPSSRPVVVSKEGGGRLTGVTALTAGDYHTCALLGTGQARCWGLNAYGQMARPPVDDVVRAAPVLGPDATTALTGILQLSAGDWHTCARFGTGQVQCFGLNDFGELGDGTFDDSTVPVTVSNLDDTGPLTGVTQIAAGEYGTCARLSSGEARCWGLNDHGQVGDGTTGTNRELPRVVRNSSDTGPLTGVRRIATGNLHTCAVLDSGQARCWGAGAGLGNGAFADEPLPVTVRNVAGTGPLGGVQQLALGDSHTCARVTGGAARCWGFDSTKQLGNGPAGSSSLPVVVLR